MHVYERTAEEKDESLVELVAKLEHPEDIIHRDGKNGKEGRVAVKLQGRRPTVAELTFLSKTADFNDGENDKAETGLSAVDSDEEAEEDDDDDDDDTNEFESGGGSTAGGSYAPLTAAHLHLIAGDDEDNESVASAPPRAAVSSNADSKSVEAKRDAKVDTNDAKVPPKRTSIFGRSKK